MSMFKLLRSNDDDDGPVTPAVVAKDTRKKEPVAAAKASAGGSSSSSSSSSSVLGGSGGGGREWKDLDQQTEDELQKKLFEVFVCAEVLAVFVPNKVVRLVDEGFRKVNGKESIKVKDLRNQLFHTQGRSLFKALKDNDVITSESEINEFHRHITSFAAEVDVNGAPLGFKMTSEQEQWSKFLFLLFALVTVWKSGETQRQELEALLESVDGADQSRQQWMNVAELVALKHNSRIYKRYKLLFYTKTPKCIEGEGLEQERKQAIQIAFKKFYRDPVANAVETPFEPIKINMRNDEIPARQNCRDFNYGVYDAREKQLEEFFPLDVFKGFKSFFSALKSLRGLLKLKSDANAAPDALLTGKFDLLKEYLRKFPHVVDLVEKATSSPKLSAQFASILGTTSFGEPISVARQFVASS